MAKEYQPATLVDALADFDGGVNQTRSPLKLAADIMAHAVNVTVRGDFATHRPPYKKRTLVYEGSATQALVQQGLFQGACFYSPDPVGTVAQPDCLIAAISGGLYQFQIVGNSITVTKVDGGTTQDPSALQHWLWQSEKWVIWNDGINLPVFYNGASCTRSSGTQLPAGRMGVYGLGRNWVALTDGRSFIASDAVGGSSGTVGNNYRDAVLQVTENAYLAGGGVFIVPGNVGDIKAMRFAATLDVSLGQGPLQVFTPTTVFSCYTPTDRLTWQSVGNPILTESLISNGAKGQNSTVVSNGDILFRSIDGIRSLIIGRRDFNTWGNAPISFEVDDILRLDDPGLLQYGSSIIFDNRMLMTTHPVAHAQGIYWEGLIPLNFDPVSSLRGKAPSVYDSGIWTGINTLQLVLGEFNDVERAFAFVLNTTTGDTGIELWEISSDEVTESGLAAPEARYDNDGVSDIPIVWTLRSAELKFGQVDPRVRQLLKLNDGEIYVDDLVGDVQFAARYYPDQYPCPVPWHSWEECQSSDDPTLSRPGFRPRIGLGEPSSLPCDASNNRSLRDFYTFQFEIQITGHCVFLGGRFKAVTQPQPEFARPTCLPTCP